MPRASKKKGRKLGESFIRVFRDTMKTPAWKSLSSHARSVFLQIRFRYTGFNNGRIGCSIRELVDECGIAKNTVRNALDELQAKGFLVETQAGSFHRKTGQSRASEWRLTDLECDMTDRKATRDYLKYKPPEPEPAKDKISNLHDFAAAIATHP